MRSRRHVLRVVSFTVLGLSSACGDSTAPRRGAAPAPNAQITDARHGSGNSHFFFLAPLVATTTYSGTFDETLSPRVEVCEWTGAACGKVVAAFSTTSGTASEVVRVDAGAQQYVVNWHTDRCVSGACTLDPLKTYRLRVLVLDTELGHADVDVVSRGSELRNVDTQEYIPLLNGRTLPVKFRIERGALYVATPSSTATTTITTAVALDGSSVTLDVLPNALTAPVALTVQSVEAASAPADSRLAGTAIYKFGPDGSTFAVPLHVTISYDPAALRAGTDQSKLRLFWTEIAADGTTRWREVAGSTVDIVHHTVAGDVSHFSYGAIGTTACTPAPVASDPIALILGQTVPAVATICDDAGQPVTGDLGYEYWHSSDESVVQAFQDGNGAWQLAATGVGSANIWVEHVVSATDTVFLQTTANVSPPTTAFFQMADDVWLPIGVETAVGTQLYWSASDTADVLGSALLWTVDDTAMVSVGAQDQNRWSFHTVALYGHYEGTTILRVSLGSVSRTSTLHVTPVASVELLPAVDTIAAGDVRQYTAVARDVAGNELAPRPATWTSSDPSVATVDSNGLVTTTGVRGGAQITVWIDGQQASLWLQTL